MHPSLDATVIPPRTTPDSGARVRSFGSLSELPADYMCLFEENAASSFFLSLPWFQNLCDTALDASDEVRIYTAETTGNRSPLLAMPMRFETGGSVFRPRVLSSLTNFYTSFYAPLFTASVDHASVLGQVVGAMCHEPLPWDAINVNWLDVDDPFFAELQRQFRQAGMVVQTYLTSGNWYAPVEGMSFRDYLESLPSSVRNIAKSKNRKIDRSGRVHVEIVRGSDGLDSALQAYQRIYAASWKSAEPYPKFIPGFVRTSASQGWLRLGVAYVDGEPAAAQIWIVSGRVASIYKIAFDERFRGLSVGTYFMMHMIRYALEVDRVRELDYLTGDHKYKQDWMSRRRERWGILAMNPRTPRGAMIIARHVGGRAIKRTLKAMIPTKTKALNATKNRADSTK